MLTATRYQFVTLNQTTVRNYQKLTYPHFRTLLNNLTAEAPVIAIGVELEAEPIALILAEYNLFSEENNKIYGQILSLFVVPDYRCQGIGTELIARMERELKKSWLCGNRITLFG